MNKKEILFILNKLNNINNDNLFFLLFFKQLIIKNKIFKKNLKLLLIETINIEIETYLNKLENI